MRKPVTFSKAVLAASVKPYPDHHINEGRFYSSFDRLARKQSFRLHVHGKL